MLSVSILNGRVLMVDAGAGAASYVSCCVQEKIACVFSVISHRRFFLFATVFYVYFYSSEDCYKISCWLFLCYFEKQR